MSVIELDVPILSPFEIEEIEECDHPFFLALHRRRFFKDIVVYKKPMYLPFWPYKKGQVVTTTEPTLFVAEEDVQFTHWSVWIKEDMKRIQRNWFPYLRREDEILCTVTLSGK